MTPNITRDVLEAQQHCRLKAYFRLSGQEGTKSDFEILQIEALQELQAKANEKIRRQYAEIDIETDISLSRTVLRTGIPFVIGGRFEDDRYSIRFDGLKKVDGASSLGEFHYEPVMFNEARRVQSDRCLLAIFMVLLSRIQGVTSGSGIVYLGRDCAVTTIRFGASLREAEDLLRDAGRLQRAEAPPKLLLNDHCLICEFRERCRAQAVREDNLSLLRGLSEKAIKSYGRKGLFTLTQLAHTFRPRRRGKRSDTPPKVHDYALQALAIRDKTIYVLGNPEAPTAAVRIYLDVESNPDEGFIYLIGLIICDGDEVERHSLWADHRNEEVSVFERFIDIVTRYDAPRVYCYGSYEKAFITRMRRQIQRKIAVDAVFIALINILSSNS